MATTNIHLDGCRVQMEIETITRDLERKKREKHRLQEEIRSLEQQEDRRLKTLLQLKADIKRANPLSPQIAENRIGVYIKRLDNLRNDNQGLRESVDKVRLVRLQVNGVLEGNIEEVKKSDDAINKLHISQENVEKQIDRITEKIKRTNSLCETERSAFTEKMKTTKEAIEAEDISIREWNVGTQNIQKKNEKYLNVNGEPSNTIFSTPYVLAIGEDTFSEIDRMKGIFKIAFFNAVQRRNIKQYQRNIDIFQQAFATIRSTTGISDVDDIVKIFMSLEEKNFSLLTYINHLSKELADYRQKIEKIETSENNESVTERTKQQQKEELVSILEESVCGAIINENMKSDNTTDAEVGGGPYLSTISKKWDSGCLVYGNDGDQRTQWGVEKCGILEIQTKLKGVPNSFKQSRSKLDSAFVELNEILSIVYECCQIIESSVILKEGEIIKGNDYHDKPTDCLTDSRPGGQVIPSIGTRLTDKTGTYAPKFSLCDLNRCLLKFEENKGTRETPTEQEGEPTDRSLIEIDSVTIDSVIDKIKSFLMYIESAIESTREKLPTEFPIIPTDERNIQTGEQL